MTSIHSGLGDHYELFRDVTQALAAFDCLTSLATVAAQATYCRPQISVGDVPCVHVVGGRHPMVEALLRESFVPNDTHMDGDGRRVLIVTGPNMGGKSSYIRQVGAARIAGSCRDRGCPRVNWRQRTVLCANVRGIVRRTSFDGAGRPRTLRSR